MKRLLIHLTSALLPLLALDLAGCGRIDRELQGIRSDVSTLDERISAVEKTQLRLRELEQQIASVEEDIKELKDSDKVTEGDINALKDKVSAISDNLSEAKKGIAPLEEETGELAEKIETINARLDSMQSRLDTILSDMDTLTMKALAAVVTVTLTHVPRNPENVETALYTRDALKISGAVTLRVSVQPESAAEVLEEVLAYNFQTLLSAKATYTLSSASEESGGGLIDLNVTGATMKNGLLSVTISTNPLDKAFILGSKDAAVALKFSYGDRESMTAFVRVTPQLQEKALITYLLETFDSNGDGQPDNMDKVTSLNLSGYGLTSIDDILAETPSLTELYCSGNAIASLDLTRTPALSVLDASDNPLLAAVDISGLTTFTSINLSGTSVKTLDPSANPALTVLNVSGTSLTKLDVTKNTALTTLDISNTVISELDLTVHTELSSVSAPKTTKLSVSSETGSLARTGLPVGQYVSMEGVTGVVFDRGLLVSTDETSKNWIEGRAWCRLKGSDWVLPTMERLRIIYDSRDVLNSTLTAVGETAFSPDAYWAGGSSTNKYYLDFSSGMQAAETQGYPHLVRAVRVF